MDLGQICRSIFDGEESILKLLGLLGRRQVTLVGQIDEMRDFFRNALATEMVRARLDSYGIDTQRLERGLAQVDELDARRVAALGEREDARKAVDARDQALDQASRWFRILDDICEVAFQDDPEGLASLG